MRGSSALQSSQRSGAGRAIPDSVRVRTKRRIVATGLCSVASCHSATVASEARFWSHGRHSMSPRQAECLACQDVSDDDRRGAPCRVSCSAIRFLIAASGFNTLIERESLTSGCARHMCREWVVLAYYFLLDCCWPKQASQASDVLIAAGPRNGGLMAIRRIISCGETQESRSRNRRRSQRSADTIMDFLAMIPRRPTSAFADPCSGGKSAISLGLPH